jgi:hypothetical protein
MVLAVNSLQAEIRCGATDRKRRWTAFIAETRQSEEQYDKAERIKKRARHMASSGLTSLSFQY